MTLADSSFNGPFAITIAPGFTHTLGVDPVITALPTRRSSDLTGGSALNGALTAEPGSTLRVQGNNQIGAVSLTVVADFTNAGASDLSCVCDWFTAALSFSFGALTYGGSVDG